MGDRVQLQQVLLKLLLNAAEAVRSVPPKRRRMIVRSILANSVRMARGRSSRSAMPARPILDGYRSVVRGFAVPRKGELPARGAASCGYYAT
jgi:hypothetical protein